MGQGDHLRIARGGAWDHAVDLGDRTVIRWAPGRGVERLEAAAFEAGVGTVERVIHRERVYRPDLVVARAFSRLAEAAYGAMFGSSEQFATWCLNGRIGASPSPAPAAPTARRPAPARRPARRPVPKAVRSRAAKAAPRRATGKAAKKTAAPKAARRPARKAARPAAPPKGARKSARKPARRGAKRRR